MGEFEKKIGVLSHIYDFLNGGYFASHNQLAFYSEEVYNLYLKNDRDDMFCLYEKLKKEISLNIVEAIEQSAGIRYFLCDGCHDAQIAKIKCIEKDDKSDYLVFDLNTSEMLGCLDLKSDNCKIIIETTKDEENRIIIDDFNMWERMYWLSNDITFSNSEIYFELKLQLFNDKQSETLNYKYKIFDILIEE